MKRNYLGLDILRGLGIFSVLTLHTAFYFFSGIFDLDLNDPPLIITLIGFFLMFAGLFAMISGLVHTIQTFRKIEEKKYSYKEVLKYSLVATLYILLIAYLYFLFTGPGLIKFDTRSYDNSLLVELIRNGRFILPSFERILYIDSLVMIGMNIILLSLITLVGYKFINPNKGKSLYFYLAALFVLAISLYRIPLYDIYLDAVDDGRYFVVLILNWLVNKNNPIFPFLSFALYGAWIATLLKNSSVKKIKLYVYSSGVLFFLLGIFMYLNTEDTMLERSIDLKWFAIMVTQIGLFKIFIAVFLSIYDLGKKEVKMNFISKFLYRFGIAGLSIFFVEQVFSSVIFRILELLKNDIYLNIPVSVGIGLMLSLFWGFMLIKWEKYHYKYGIEYFYTKAMSKFGGSEKENKLNG
jgi:uncharacterized membrane protein YidH (DUF202 family)